MAMAFPNLPDISDLSNYRPILPLRVYSADGVMMGEFRKDVPRYLHDRQYETGWDDGFRQCQAMQQSQDQDTYRSRHWDERDQQWQQEKDRDAARAYRRQ